MYMPIRWRERERLESILDFHNWTMPSKTKCDSSHSTLSVFNFKLGQTTVLTLWNRAYVPFWEIDIRFPSISPFTNSTIPQRVYLHKSLVAQVQNKWIDRWLKPSIHSIVRIQLNLKLLSINSTISHLDHFPFKQKIPFHTDNGFMNIVNQISLSFHKN